MNSRILPLLAALLVPAVRVSADPVVYFFSGTLAKSLQPAGTGQPVDMLSSIGPVDSFSGDVSIDLVAGVWTPFSYDFACGDYVVHDTGSGAGMGSDSSSAYWQYIDPLQHASGGWINGGDDLLRLADPLGLSPLSFAIQGVFYPDAGDETFFSLVGSASTFTADRPADALLATVPEKGGTVWMLSGAMFVLVLLSRKQRVSDRYPTP